MICYAVDRLFSDGYKCIGLLQDSLRKSYILNYTSCLNFCFITSTFNYKDKSKTANQKYNNHND